MTTGGFSVQEQLIQCQVVVPMTIRDNLFMTHTPRNYIFSLNKRERKLIEGHKIKRNCPSLLYGCNIGSLKLQQNTKAPSSLLPFSDQCMYVCSDVPRIPIPIQCYRTRHTTSAVNLILSSVCRSSHSTISRAEYPAIYCPFVLYYYAHYKYPISGIWGERRK